MWGRLVPPATCSVSALFVRFRALFANSARSDHAKALEALSCDGTSFEAALHCAEEIIREQWRQVNRLARTLSQVETLSANQVQRVLRQSGSLRRGQWVGVA